MFISFDILALGFIAIALINEVLGVTRGLRIGRRVEPPKAS